MDEFVLPDGSIFDLNVGLGNDLQTRKFQRYGTFLEGTRKRLLKFGRRPKKVEAFYHIGAEVGDDEIGVSSTPEYGAAELTVFSEFLGMKESEPDTSINPRFGNYAEDLVVIPDGYEQTYRYASQTSDMRNMAFLDVPKLRLAIDIRPGRMDHSSTNDGKAGMLGSRLAWLPRQSPVRCIWEVFNLMQDINLGLMRDSKFPYLPTALGGYGKPLPFGKASNFEAIITRYKQGTHAGMARELVRRANRRFREYTLDKGGNTDEVLSAVSRLQSSWHDWIKGKSLYAPTCWLEAPPEVVAYRVAKHGTDVRLDSALRRLQSVGHLVTESDLAIAYEHNQLCAFLVSCETHNEFLARRAESRKQWLNLSTFSLRLYGYLEKLGVDESLQSVLDPKEWDEFWLSITKKKLHLRSFLRQENFYDAKAKDIVYMNGPMMVRSLSLFPRVTQMGRRYWYQPSTDLPDDLEVKAEFDSLLEWVKGDPLHTNPPSRRIVNDDEFIIKEILMSEETKGFCIITDDIALCREAYNRTRHWVVRIPVKWYYMNTYYGTGDEPWLKVLKDRYPFYEWVTIQDTGSIESYEEIGFRDGLPILWPAERPFRLTKPSFRNGRRIRAQRTQPDIEDNQDWEPYRFPDGYIYASGKFLQRKKHPYRRGWA